MKIRTSPLSDRTRRFRRLYAVACAAALLLLLVLRPQRYAAACAEGIALWAKVVLPALFPFLVLTAWIARSGMADGLGRKLSPLLRRCGLPAASAGAFLLSIVSGYPVGSRVVADLQRRGEIGRADAEKLSILCSTSGPMFILGSVGNAMFGGGKAGAVLLSAHLFGVLAVALPVLLFRNRSAAAEPSPPPAAQRSAEAAAQHLLSARAAATQARAPSGTLGETVREAVLSVLGVGGFIALANVALCAAEDLLLLAPPHALAELCLRPFGAQACAEGIVYGLIEATRGCAALAAADAAGLPFAAFAITFGGASILAQQLAFLRPVGVRAGRFIAVKAAQGCAAALFCALLLAF